MSDFIPEIPDKSVDVPFYDDVTSEGGWQGHSTSKSIQGLQSEISQAFGRLGGMITGFQRGIFSVNGNEREGFRINYTIQQSDGSLWPGKMDIAALPVKNAPRNRRSYDTRKEKSLKMALYMVRVSLNGAWFLQQLSPGYAALLPWMIAPGNGEKNFTELWTEAAMLENLLPAGEVIDGEFEEVK